MARMDGILVPRDRGPFIQLQGLRPGWLQHRKSSIHWLIVKLTGKSDWHEIQQEPSAHA